MFDYLFCLRPSVICNMHCSYCYRESNLHEHLNHKPFNIDSMIWHSNNYPNNMFNFCGYGETMMHPQFDDIIIELSKVTKVNWVTNGTMFTSSKFKNIIKNANLSNIYDIIVSVHLNEIYDMESYIINYYNAVDILHNNGIKIHATTIINDANIDTFIAYKDFFPSITVKLEWAEYTQGKKLIKSNVSNNTLSKLYNNLIFPEQDQSYIYEYIGKYCTCGDKIFEVHYDGTIYDCYYDVDKQIIGNINIQSKIKEMQAPRLCKTHHPHCIPTLRNEFNLVKI